MGRPKKWSSDAERMASKRRVNGQPDRVNGQDQASKRTANEQDVRIDRVNEHEGFVFFRHQPQVPLSLFDGVGRGSPRGGFVMVSRHEGSEFGELGVVTQADWEARLRQMCEHGHRGWACHVC